MILLNYRLSLAKERAYKFKCDTHEPPIDVATAGTHHPGNYPVSFRLDWRAAISGLCTDSAGLVGKLTLG